MARAIGWILAGQLVACGGADAPATPVAAEAAPVRTWTAQRTPLTTELSLVGTVEADDSVELRPESSGAVVEVGCKDGAQVRAGELLVRLRDQDARAGLAEARARSSLAENDLQRAKALFERQNISQAELDRASAERDLASAAVAKAEEALRRTRVVAPFAGTLGLCDVTLGQVVDPGTVIAQLEALDRLVVDLSVPEAAVGQVRAAMKATVAFPQLAIESCPGTVSAVAPRVDRDDRSTAVRVTLDAACPGVLPGMSAAVRVAGEHTMLVMAMPAGALVQGAAGPTAYVIDAEGKAASRSLRLGERREAAVVVLEGLADGDRVIVEGLARVRPGAPVTDLGATAP